MKRETLNRNWWVEGQVWILMNTQRDGVVDDEGQDAYIRSPEQGTM